MTLATPLLLSAAVYAPILDSYFFADDFLNLVGIADRGCARFAFEPQGGHVLLARNLLMCAHYGLFGVAARWYFAVVLATHLLNVGLLFRVIHLLTRRRGVACIGATLWGVSPLHVESLGWYAVYGHVLTCTGLLIALAVFLPHTDRRARGPGTGVSIACAILLLIGATCFGTGLAIAVATPLAILVMVPAARHGAVRTILVGTALATLPLYIGLLAIARRFSADPGTHIVVAIALSRIDVVPSMLAHLVRHGLLGLLAGPWAHLANAWTVVGVAACLVAAGVALGDGVSRRAMLSAALLALAAYGAIALGRAGLSDALGGPTVTATTQRYHYAGAAALTICLAVATAVLCCDNRAARVVAAVTAGLVAALGWGLVRHPVDVSRFRAARPLVAETLARVDAAIERVPPGGTVYIPNQPLQEITFLLRRAKMPGTAGLVLMVDGDDQRLGRTVWFWEPDAQLRRAFAPPTSRWVSRMLVAPRVHLDAPPSRPVTSACELVAAKRVLALVRRLLRCEREAVSGRVDVAGCQAAAQAAYDRSAVACEACVDPRALGQRLRAGIDASRWWLRCMTGPDATPPSVRCSEAALVGVRRLVDGLFACHRRSVLRDRLLDDAACEDRADDAYRAHLSRERAACGPCFGDVLAPAVRQTVARVFADVFCGALGPPTDGGAMDPTRP